MREFMRITKALADPNRVRALLALNQGELCVCQLSELFRLAPSTMSKHLSILYQAGLIESRKDERWVFYRLAGKGVSVTARGAIEWTREALLESLEAVEDGKKLKRILKINPSTICQRLVRR